jgi:predicted transcriptional regulator
VLWQYGPSTVRTVNEHLNEHREVNYSSTLKLMQLMEGKGLLKRDTNDRSHVYRPAENPEKVQTQVVNGLRDLAFGGSTSRLVLRALGDGSATPEELEEIKRLIEKMQKKG